jgi:hypothetical protein
MLGQLQRLHNSGEQPFNCKKEQFKPFSASFHKPEICKNYDWNFWSLLNLEANVKNESFLIFPFTAMVGFCLQQMGIVA